MKTLIVDLEQVTITGGTWEEVAGLFGHLKDYNGDTQLEMYVRKTGPDALDNLPYLFMVRKVGPYYFPAKLDAENELWHYYNPNGVEEAGWKRKIDADDGYRDALTMTLDYDLVFSMAKEFYETGDVELLDY